MQRDFDEILNKFDEYDPDNYLQFEAIQNKKSNRTDLHAFIVLDEWFPGNSDIIASAEHDEFFLGIEAEQIQQLTDDQILELVRCGVSFSEEYQCLCMFA